MATVYLGRLTGSAGFSRTVAIKRLHPHLTNEGEFVAMLVDEARLAGRVRHPNVVPMLDVVQLEGELMLIMEYVHGEALGRLLRLADGEGLRVVPVPIASAILIAMLQGLHAAHEAKDESGAPLSIVHRDVSPQNVIIGVDGVARILDFGVAKATGRLNSTTDGQLKGKLAYMAPEQLQGARVDRRVDIWAAGVVLWEALCGRRLFSADSDVLIIPRVLSDPLDAPSTFVDIPKELDAVVLRALERHPDARFATALDMAVAVEKAAPPATSRAVAEWVVRSLGRQLESRTAVLARVERWVDGEQSPFDQGAQAVRSISSRNSHPEISAQADSTHPESTVAAPIRTSRVSATDELPAVGPMDSQVASAQSPVGKPLPTTNPNYRKRWLYLFGTVGLILSLSGLAFAVRRTHSRLDVPLRAQAANLASEPPSTGTSERRTNVLPTEADATPISHVVTVTTNATNSVSHLVEVPAIQSARVVRTTKPIVKSEVHSVAPATTSTAIQASTVAASPVACDPPYSIGPAPDFIRKPKLECLR